MININDDFIKTLYNRATNLEPFMDPIVIYLINCMH